jgi:hypothetical protein
MNKQQANVGKNGKVNSLSGNTEHSKDRFFSKRTKYS